jgi:shikimate kinase
MTRRSIRKCIDVINARLDGRPVVLIGLMGAGKTTVGRRLARRLDLPFVDADAEIESAAGRTVAEIFAEDGEAFFRAGEERVIARLLESGPQVLATGGGAWTSEKTRDLVAKKAISVWLRANLDVLMERVSRRPGRPLLQNPDPRAVMKKLMDERYPLYALADITVESREAPHQTIVNDIILALADWLEGPEEAA